ncbi:MAG: bifunctional (p)ppGpp synthetase/guanosine-3',5'-bis(diphosphate) 3'-pyrophosphohydrolase [Deltaproteobacteria bacterium]|nr:bifunctional (p)ppGpp synthetase/guanosine-3',5'-bis(diphosphate) 3'-pyrophosphohydrolase [Deltaproteobacteria bacterium]
MLRFEDIIEKVQRYNAKADLTMLRRGYIYSAKVHQGQVRMSGEPYLTHPLEVAGIMADLEVDVPSIVAALLHDTVEDTYATLEEIEEYFGEEVAALVDGMTKISKMEYKTREERQAENFRKMILAMVNDIRVILIKLSDRLHNMRTLEYLSRTKQLRIARETLDIYVPIAHRLGIWVLQRELEDLCLKILHPEIYRQIAAQLPAQMKELDIYALEIALLLQDQLKEFHLKAEVEGRHSSIYGIYTKMRTHKIPFERIYNIIRLRIFVDKTIDCYTLLGVIHNLWKPVPGKFQDYIGVPKTNQYQSLHTLVMGHKGHPVKFQILTRSMQRRAERGITTQWKYKQSPKESLEQKAERFFWLKRLLQWQKELLDSREFMISVKEDLFPDVIYTFTPQGEVRELLKGSTPIDFAFNIHTEIGKHAVGSRVNGRDVALDYSLSNGDTIEILTSEDQVPQREWLRFARTPKARARIKDWVRGRERERSIEFGQALLLDSFKKFQIDPALIENDERFGEMIQKLGFHDREKLLENLGYGKISVLQVVEKFLPAREFKRLKKKEVKLRKKEPYDLSVPGIKVTGMEDAFIHLASCCNPVPGDRIIAFIGDKRGVSVHEIDCPLVQELDVNPERRIEVQWDADAKIPRPVKVRVEASDQPGVLADICSAITAQGGNIGRTQVVTGSNKTALCQFEIEVYDRTQLDEILASIRKNKTVKHVERIKGVEGSKSLSS